MPQRKQAIGPHSVIGSIQAHRLAYESERIGERTARNEALAAILARLDKARRDNAESYLTDRLRRETSADLS